MVDTCVAPSELHLKKELTALRKARFLRDPETSSSWRTPLNTKSIPSGYSLNNENANGGNSGQRYHGELFQLPSSGNIQKRVFLYNWRNLSSKSIGSDVKLDDYNKHVSAEESLEDAFNYPDKGDSTSERETPSNIYSARGRASATAERKTVRRLRNGISRKHMTKHSSVSKLLDLPSTSLGVLNPVEQSYDTEFCNSEEFSRLRHETPQKATCHSLSSSPLLSGSGRGNWSYASKILRTSRREGSTQSCTPASTSSYYRYGGQNPNNVESWDGTAASLDGDELDQLDLPKQQGCGIPCYWGKKTKDRGCGGFYSPSLSDTLRRKGSSLFCGSQTLNNKKRSSGPRKQKFLSKYSQGLPLLSNSCDGGNSSLDTASDELSINFGELELEALSRLDGRRWSSCKSQDGLQSARSAEVDLETVDKKSLSQKYSPKTFEEIIGQNIVVHSLNSALAKGRIAPAYLFQGPRGTGKTSTARIFAASLNCLSTEDNKPCGLCSECTAVLSGNGSNVKEVDAINKKGVDIIRYLLKNMFVANAVSRYKVIIIDECHMLSSTMWSKFMNFLEEPTSHVVFIFITIDPENLPRAILSRCQKYGFSKVKDVDIICRLRKLSYEENLDIELDALNLIALNSDGSLRDAETMLEQLSLLGKKITTSLVHELVGVVSDEKLLDLLEIAMSSDTAETVKRSRELMSSGVDPMALMSQLAGLIMDIIAGSNQLANSQCSSIILGSSLSEDELKRLQQALKILSNAEKQLRLSNERSTWFTAALLQLGSSHNAEFTQSSISSKCSARTDDGAWDMVKDSTLTIRESNSVLVSRATSGYSSPHSCPSAGRRNEKLISDTCANALSGHEGSGAANASDGTYGEKEIIYRSPDKLALIWSRCIQKCHSGTLRQLLSAHGKLVSITESEGALAAYVKFEDVNAKSRAERYLSSITNSIERVLHHNVQVKIGLIPGNRTKALPSESSSPSGNHTGKEGLLEMETTVDFDSLKISGQNRDVGTQSLPRKSLDCSEAMLQRTKDICNISSVQDGIDEHRLESAWLQVSDKNSLESASQSNPNKNQVYPQSIAGSENHRISSMALAVSSKLREEELNYGRKSLNIGDNQKKQTGGQADHYTISPSFLHNNDFTTNFDKENPGYESGPGCSGLLCWQPRRSYRGKVKKGTHGQSPKTARFHCLCNVRRRRT